MEQNEMPWVTGVLTSCGRLDLLEKTLNSFIIFNSYEHIKEFIIVEDSGDPEIARQLRELNDKKYNGIFKLIINEHQIGQTASIDKAYAQVDTDYIFHCENDWQFYRKGFIEASIGVLESQPKVLQCWIRPKSDGILNRIEPKVFQLPGGYKVRRVLPHDFTYNDVDPDGVAIQVQVSGYIGFSFNPGVKRMSDYRLIKAYSIYKHEHLVDRFYKENSYMVVSLSENDTDGYVKHIGWNNRTKNYEV
jgi:hypothetical protein